LQVKKGNCSVNLLTEKDKETALHIALLRQHDKVTDTVIMLGADLNLKNARGFTPLHIAVMKRSRKLVTKILHARQTVDLSSQDEDGDTAVNTAMIQVAQEQQQIGAGDMDLLLVLLSGRNACASSSLTELEVIALRTSAPRPCVRHRDSR
jgi:ankyrin repeat protein